MNEQRHCVRLLRSVLQLPDQQLASCSVIPNGPSQHVSCWYPRGLLHRWTISAPHCDSVTIMNHYYGCTSPRMASRLHVCSTCHLTFSLCWCGNRPLSSSISLAVYLRRYGQEENRRFPHGRLLTFLRNANMSQCPTCRLNVYL